ncbi:MAG: hypothetical protein ACT4NY_19525 [Pseudonocardiales bacterium]
MSATSDLVVMLDGATIRTETGCRHGAAWFTRKLGALIIARAASRSTPLDRVLANAISDVAALHPECDITHPGTPSAAAAIVRLDADRLCYLVLGDVTIVLDTLEGVQTVSDQRVSTTAAAERAVVDRYLIGSPEKSEALVKMKHAELAARNQPGGYWIAAADPAAVTHAVSGEIRTEDVRRLAVLTDGAARFVDLFALGEWRTVLNVVARCGPQWFITQLVRSVESADPLGARYPRNKTSDDATVVFAELADVANVENRPDVLLEAELGKEELLRLLDNPRIYGDGNLSADSGLRKLGSVARQGAAPGCPGHR